MRLKKSPRKGLCIAWGCSKERQRGKKYCNRHHYISKKEANPIRIVWQALKDNAGRREKEFSITLDEFKTWCADNDYMEKRGRHVDSLSIDRIRQNEGYHINNIQILTNVQNIKKYYVHYRTGEDDYAPSAPPEWTEPPSAADDWANPPKIEDGEDCPF